MGSNRVQNVGAGIVDSDASNVGQVRAVEKIANQQGAIAAAVGAMSSISELAVGETAVTAGVGASGGQGALALGLVSRIRDNLTLKGVAGASGKTKSVGLGLSYTFKVD